jgi:hypothetical protein
MLLVLLAVMLIGAAGSMIGGAESNDPYDIADDYVDDYLEEYEGSVTAHQVIDPWIPEDPENAPPPGRRFIAVEVTVENDTGGEIPVYASSGQFQLKDREQFVEDAVVYSGPRAEPELPEVTLGEGEKARGWVTFEVDENADIETMSYWTQDVPLP